ncbi:hypothetical protein [Lewinella sp. 4G2]|uniref:hypothetical protein n=1 Tax=Lewinella sp. 4G2 TaxID=1803372 RepID=UPI0012F838A1|nr:hypothetical protein [Lewinella sp. 4G2]
MNDAQATMTDDNPGGNEQAYEMIMDTDSGTITLSRVDGSGTNKMGIPKSGPGHIQLSSPEEVREAHGPNAASFGDVHTHQNETGYSSVADVRDRNNAGPDGTNARRRGVTTFSIGAKGSTIGHNRQGSTIVGPNSSVYSGQISLIQRALDALKK